MAGGEREGLRVSWDQFKLTPRLELCEREGLTCANIFSKINFVIACTGIPARCEELALVLLSFLALTVLISIS